MQDTQTCPKPCRLSIPSVNSVMLDKLRALGHLDVCQVTLVEGEPCMYGLPSAGGAARGVAGGAPPPPPAGGVVRGRPPAREAPKPASSARATAGQLLLLRGYGELRGELDENLKPITFQSSLLFLVSQSQALDTSPSVSMTGRQANCQDRRGQKPQPHAPESPLNLLTMVPSTRLNRSI